jgi:hypothetical protein
VEDNMPKYRQLHTKIIDSFDFNEMPDDFTRVVWLLLTLILDSEGRGIDTMAWVRSKIFPLRQDISLEQLNVSFAWLESRKMIIRYTIDSKGYFYIPTFKTYQSMTSREAPSNFPPPPKMDGNNSGSTPEQVLSNSGATLLKSKAESESESEAEESSLDPFDLIQRIIEEITGLPPEGPKAVDAINELMSMKAVEVDIRAGYEWVRDKTIKGFRYYGQLVGPTRTAMAKRLQAENKDTPPNHVYPADLGWKVANR